jgi:hypothetical protein
MAHVNIVIDTMISFVGGEDTKTLDRGIAGAREEHDLYTLEIVRLLGITLGPAANVPVSTVTPTP